MTNGKILIINDSLINQELLEETLATFSYEIASYSNPIEALKKEKETKVDLLIIDDIMSEINIFNFAEKFLQEHANTPIVFISAYNKDEDKIKSFNLGSYVYIEKPFDIKTLRAQIRSILKVKALQDKLFEEKQKLDNIFEFSSNEIILTDLNFNIISNNNKILNNNKNTELNFLKFLGNDIEPYCLNELKDFINSSENHFQFRLFLGQEKYVKTTISKVKTDNKLSGYMIVMEDLTKEIEKQNIINNFIEMLTHDLKTPVRAEKRALKLLYEGCFGELNKEQHEIVQELLNSSRFMLRMTDNVLTRYKIENGDCIINKSKKSILDSIQSSIYYLQYMIESKNQKIIIHTNFKNNNDEIAQFDETEINRVLTNILSNASEFSPQNSNIEIFVNKNDKNISVSIKDCGSGIPENILSSILHEKILSPKRFKKVGSGLGIYISKKIIEAHGGKIEIKTSEKDGTIFTFYLPCEELQKSEYPVSI